MLTYIRKCVNICLNVIKSFCQRKNIFHIFPHIVFCFCFLLQKVLPSLLHGEAVNIDMAYMVYVSQESGLLTEAEKQRIINCMVSLELPVWHQACTMELIEKSLQDRLKHSGGLVRMPLPVGLGQAGKNHSDLKPEKWQQG